MVTYKKGDLLKSGCDILCHQVNCQGVMGSGIAKILRDTYPRLFNDYIQTISTYHKDKVLGHVGFSQVTPNRIVVNMFSQFHYLPRNVVNTNYSAFRNCCKEIKEKLSTPLPYSTLKIGFPYNIGCGLAGGDWSIVSKIIEEEFDGPEWDVEIWKL